MQILGEKIYCRFAKDNKYTEIPKLNIWELYEEVYTVLYTLIILYKIINES